MKNTKKILLAIGVILITCLLYAQSGFVWRVISPPGAPTASGSSPWYSTSATGTSYASLSWTPVGTFSGCTVQIDFSNDGSTVAGQLIAAQTCTSTGSIIAGSSSTPAFVRVTYTLTGGTYLKYVAMGCTNTTCTSSSGGTLTGITAGTNITIGGSAPSPTVAVTNNSTTVNGQTCTLGSTCTIPGSPVTPNTIGYPVTADSSSAASGSPVFIDVSKIAGATMDVKIRTAITNMGANTSAMLDASAINGAQTFTTSNPFIDLVGQGYAPSKTGILRLCNVKITTQWSIVVPAGWHVIGCGKVFSGNSGVQIVAGASFITTTTGTNTSNTGASGTPFISVVTGTGFTAAMEGALYVTCLNTTDLSCIGGTAGSAAYGNIHFINSTTINVWTPSTGTGNANTAVSYAIYGCVICMGDTSSIAGGGNQNFDVDISGMVIDSGGKAGAVPLLNWNCSNLCSAWDLGLRVSDNVGFDIEGSATQNSGPYYRLWLTSSSCTTANAMGMIVRSTGTSTIFSLHDFSIAQGGCGTGTQYNILLDAQAHIGPAIHIVGGSNVNSEGVVLGKGNTIPCPVACPQAPGSIKGAYVEDVNMTGTALNVVDIGTNSSPINYSIVKLLGDPSSAITNTLTDNNRSPVCNISNTAEPQLVRYEGGPTGLWHSSSQQTNCLSNDGVNGAANPVSTAPLGTNSLGQIVQAGQVNAQTATYQVLAADFQLHKVITVASGTFNVTLVASGTQPVNGQYIDVINYGSGAVSIVASGQNINGAATTIVIPATIGVQPVGFHIVSDGTNYFATYEGNVVASAVLTNTGVCNGVGTNKIQCANNIKSNGSILSTYNSIATTGNGVASVNASTGAVTTGSGTSIGLTSLCSTAQCPAGTYNVSVYIDITTACGTSGTYTILLTWTDDQGSKSAFTVPIAGTGVAAGVLTTTSAVNWGQALMTIRTTGTQPLQYSTTAVACGTAGPMVGKMYFDVTRLE